MINAIRFVTNAYVYFVLLNFGSCLDDLQSSIHLKWNHYDNRTSNSTRLQFQCENEQEIEENFFQCDNGACIYKIHECDGIEQCTDGSDEWAQTCEKYSVENRQKRATSGDCVAPPSSPDRTFIYECDTNENTGSCFINGLIRESTIAKVVCKANYLAVDEYGYESSCTRKKWYPNLRKCYKTCDTLTPKNLDLECYRNNVGINCKENTLRSGDKVKISCKPQHTFQSNVPPNYNQITCREDGSWDKDLFSCIPICGRSFTAASTLISNGVLEHFGDSPWHVAIYNQKKILICGGTIIHPLLVLSAAHCFYYEDGKMQNSENFEVVVSKVSRNYAIKDNAYQKTYKIKEIRFSEFKGYYSLTSYYSADIAILVLKEEITIGPTVLPACIDTTRKKYYPPEGTLAKVVGWGMNENGEYSELLHTANLPYIGRKRCLETVNEDFKPYITLDKFCAGSKEKEGAGVLQGDSGGGILFQEFGFYFIRGIVSIKQPVDNSKIAAFTDLADHMDWILSVRDQMDQESNITTVQIQTDRKIQYFDVDLLRQTYQKTNPKENLVFSPASIKVMLALLLEGAAGQSEKELGDALGLPEDKYQALANLQLQLATIKDANTSFKMDFQNKLFFASDEKISRRYIDVLSKKYGAEFEKIDFLKQDEAVHLINTWVNKDTRGITTSLVTKDDLYNGTRTRLVLADCIHFKVEWKFAFDARKTFKSYFFTVESESKLKTMHAVYMLGAKIQIMYHEDIALDAKIAEIPFKDERYTFTIVLPNQKGGITKLLRDLTHTSLMRLFGETKSRTVNVILPKTTIKFRAPLADSFRDIDVKDVFTSTANLTGILENNKPIFVKNIFHYVKIELTEGAGVPASLTSGSATVLLSPNRPLEFKADHPFVFYIRDLYTSAFLFEGILLFPDESYNGFYPATSWNDLTDHLGTQ